MGTEADEVHRGVGQIREEGLPGLPPDLPSKQREEGRRCLAWWGGIPLQKHRGWTLDLCSHQVPTSGVVAPGSLLLFVSFSPLEKQNVGLYDP